MKLDILVIAAHPDDAELSCAGTIIKHVEMGKKVGVVDLTQGEMGTRGNVELRMKEADEAAKVMGLSIRENLKMEDGFFANDREHQVRIAKIIRKYRPEIILTNAEHDRHPDHGRAAQLVNDSCFVSGLRKLKTEEEGKEQEAWRPDHLYHFIQSRYIRPDLVVDISNHWDRKEKAIMAYKSQFFDPNSDEPETFISSRSFMDLIRSRAVEFGTTVGVRFAEGFTRERYPAVDSLFDVK